MTFPSISHCWSSAALIACTVHSDEQICSCPCQEEGTHIKTDNVCLHAACTVCTKIVYVHTVR